MTEDPESREPRVLPARADREKALRTARRDPHSDGGATLRSSLRSELGSPSGHRIVAQDPMALTLLSGTAHHIRYARGNASAASSAPSLRGARSCSFRIGDRFATIQLPNAASVMEDDRVTVAGYERAGGFVAYALRNETTGAKVAPAVWPLRVCGMLLVAAGVALSTRLVGIPSLAVGLWMLFAAHRIAAASSLLERKVAGRAPDERTAAST